ncbi:hypothetical protein [Umezakia ovalisporum]|uniref:Plastid lipid-associated protein/fibrillin conserved domain-containing protein n=1 Tax=Umezakia ovalisporum FSS-43 TaxID=2740520 RepID=A0ABT6K0Q8_9CYAN|nr:hypothetical protein [Umezakia ovalisporum]MDH6055955.1 hypothetical protein [Umezakia ovalisporum FSS-43]MDH6066151.1 hypothetical protein [Umezakia ovalisporum APH033B]MDH6072587.1 hypothetical protein [Umezakia ovalisporum CobakiLakeA]MDH6074097.1 hypothetical protein [Umezakia ovalisporum CS-1034]MDH6078999.1 hypothetical protein [Umezakia ovalisporum FSS-45]
MADFTSTLSEAAAAYCRKGGVLPTGETMVNALLQAEKASQQQGLSYPLESLVGKWQLCFATGTKKARKRAGTLLGKGLYLPKFLAVHISFSGTLEQDSGKGEIGNQVQLGPVLLQLTGPAKYLGKKNLLAFDFNYMVLRLFGSMVYNKSIRSGEGQTHNFYDESIAKLPFFVFFLVTEDLIAARGRGGGLALWIREQ